MTRGFLADIETQAPQLPKFALTDFDPDGLHIYSCYRHGTKNFAHKSRNVNLDMTWLGVQSHQLVGANTVGAPVLSNFGDMTSVVPPGILVELSLRDRKYARNMLRKSLSTVPRDIEQMDMCHELQRMLMLGVKAEVQAMDNFGDITRWLDASLSHALGTH